MRYTITLAVLVTAVAIFSTSSAQAPDSLSFQGLLTDSQGNPIDSNNVSMTFKLYLKDGTVVWTEPQTVDVENGVFDVLLGKVTDLSTFAFDQPFELGIKLDGEASEMSPRTPLAAAAYAKALPGFYTFSRGSDPLLNRSYNVVGGAAGNVVGSTVTGATIGGGGGFVSIDAVPNRVLADFGTVGGGAFNTTGGLVGGLFATVGGGIGNTASAASTTVGGGQSNTASEAHATVGGGFANTASEAHATVGGGQSNTASNIHATVGGGTSNTVSGVQSTVAGGRSNTASGNLATVPGGLQNVAGGAFSFAAGQRAHAVHEGTFVWNDNSVPGPNDSLISTGLNQFLIRAAGGVGIGTNSPISGSQLDVNGAIHIGGSFSETMLFKNTSASGSSGLDDGVRFRYDGNFGGSGKDYLVIEKTDANQNAPDGGIAFVNTGADGVIETALQIFGSGSVSIPGTLTKGNGTFKIDHPLDPLNKFLYHSFVESPDMMNVYNGNVILDGSGEAEIELPAYFEALNRDFRYQLTPIGFFAPVFVADKVSGNQFKIAGGEPGMEVSWQVTGIRKDPFAAANPIEVEVDKAPEERGTYLHPAAYSASN